MKKYRATRRSLRTFPALTWTQRGKITTSLLVCLFSNGNVSTKGVIGEHKDNLKLYIDSKLNGSFNL